MRALSEVPADVTNPGADQPRQGHRQELSLLSGLPDGESRRYADSAAWLPMRLTTLGHFRDEFETHIRDRKWLAGVCS